MSDPTPTADAPAADAATPAQAATPTAPAADGEETISLDQARKLRQEHKSLRDRLAEYERLDTEAKRAAMTETDRLKAEKADADTRAQAAHVEVDRLKAELAIKDAAVKAGIDTELATSLLKPDQLERDDKGQFTNVAKAVEKLIARWPHLVAGPDTPPPSLTSPTNPARNGRGHLTRDDIKKMTPDEINRRWDEVSAVLAAG